MTIKDMKLNILSSFKWIFFIYPFIFHRNVNWVNFQQHEKAREKLCMHTQ